MGSMSSLNDDHDWPDGDAFAEDADGEASGAEGLGERRTRGADTASLLQQITDLALKAGQDF